MFLILLQFGLIACQDIDNFVVLGNIKKRDQIPLSQINKRFNHTLDYRRTKDIRDTGGFFRRDGMIFNKNRKIDESIFNYKSDPTYDRAKLEIADRKRDEAPTEIDVMDKQIDRLDRRFKYSERELNRMDKTQDKLEKLHKELQWLTVNADEGEGFKIGK